MSMAYKFKSLFLYSVLSKSNALSNHLFISCTQMTILKTVCEGRKKIEIKGENKEQSKYKAESYTWLLRFIAMGWISKISYF